MARVKWLPWWRDFLWGSFTDPSCQSVLQRAPANQCSILQYYLGISVFLSPSEGAHADLVSMKGHQAPWTCQSPLLTQCTKPSKLTWAPSLALTMT
ncbi:hypothetical protein MHYP_G00244580 [Metynnis hypsauchen]